MKKRFIYLLMVIIMSMMALFLCSCEGIMGNESPDPIDGEKPEGEVQDKKDGWEKIETIENKEMYIKFLSGFTGVAYELSKDKVEAKQAVTADGKARFTLNGNHFWLSVKGKYDCSDSTKIRQRTIIAIEVSTEEEITSANRIISLLFYQDELYISIGNNKAKFDISKLNWTKYYPYEMDEIGAKDLSNIAGVLSSYIKLNDLPKGYYRRNSIKEEYKYSIDVNLKVTLQNILGGIDELTKDSELIVKIKDFIASILGISVEGLMDGEIPSSDVKMDFVISGNTIQSLNMNAKIDMSHSDSNLIQEDELNIGLELDNVKITHDWSNGVSISAVTDSKELASYIDYDKAIFYLTIPIKIYNENNEPVSNNYEFKITMRIFQDNNVENFLFMEYYNTDTQKIDRALYVYDNIGYLFLKESEKGDAECIYQHSIDLSDIASRVVENNLNGNRNLDIYEMVAYIFRNLLFSSTEIGFAVNHDFFTDIWYNFYDMIDFIDEINPDKELLDVPEINEFITYFTTNEVIFTISFNDENMLKIIEKDAYQIVEIIEKLANIDDNNALQP